MKSKMRRWVIEAVVLLAVGVICCLVVAVVGSISEYKWLAMLLVVGTFVLLRALATFLDWIGNGYYGEASHGD
jgi:hypothetical protein